jgi:4-hydroxy-tetrahydrodipicolinate synthase
LLGHYLSQGVSGVIPLGTTGESPTVEPYEAEALVDLTLEVVNGRVPVFVGIGGNSTRKVIKMVRRLERYRFQGILSVCPYYNRPSEEGIGAHFRELAQSTDRSILIYNIPYRTGVNLSNDAVLELSTVPNIVGIKDSCASLSQTLDLLNRKSPGFSVVTGEDALLYTTVTHGGDGGILASAHWEPRTFLQVFERIKANDHLGARPLWNSLEPMIRLLFREANPMPLKYLLWKQGLIRSPECRMPLTRVSRLLSNALDSIVDPTPTDIDLRSIDQRSPTCPPA